MNLTSLKVIHKAKLPEDFIRMIKQGKNQIQQQKGRSSLMQKQRDEQVDSVTEYAESRNYKENHACIDIKSCVRP